MLIAGQAAAALLPAPALASKTQFFPSRPWRDDRAGGSPDPRRSLRLLRRATGERFDGDYSAGRATSDDAYSEICWLLRDVRSSAVHQIDSGLIELMCKVQQEVNGRELIVNSGFRTRETNALLRRKGAARNSLHLTGEAVDFFVRGVPVEELARIVRRQRKGGVGVYPGRGFVHMDIGPLRAWRG